MTASTQGYDCIIIGAGPGGLQAAIHLARYNRKILLLDKGGGRTRHAIRMENYLGHLQVSGKELVDLGLAQIKRLGVEFRRAAVEEMTREQGLFILVADNKKFSAPFVIASSGGRENLPRIKNLQRFWGKSIFTCVDCDGVHTTGKKLVIVGNSLDNVRLALGMKQMFTADISLVLPQGILPDDYREILDEERISCFSGDPLEVLGDDRLSGLRLADGRVVECEVLMTGFGYRLNDGYLEKFDLRRDSERFKILTDHLSESSLPNLFVVGALRSGSTQAIIAAGQGAAAAIEINKRLLAI